MRLKSREVHKQHVDINGRTYQCYLKGNCTDERLGDLVFFNGFFSGSNSWAYQTRIPFLLEHFRLVMFDYPSQGTSSPLRQDITPEELVDDIITLLATLGVKNCVLIGHSLGGFIAGRLAAALVEKPGNHIRVRGMLVCNSSTRSPFSTDKLFREIARRFALIPQHPNFPDNQDEQIKDIFRLFMPMAIGDNYLERMDDFEADLLTTYATYNNDPEGLSCLLHSMLRGKKDVATFLAAFSTVTCPVHIISGLEDKIFPPAMGHELAAAYPNASLSELKNAGHSVMLEQHHAVNETLIDVVKSVF